MNNEESFILKKDAHAMALNEKDISIIQKEGDKDTIAFTTIGELEDRLEAKVDDKISTQSILKQNNTQNSDGIKNKSVPKVLNCFYVRLRQIR